MFTSAILSLSFKNMKKIIILNTSLILLISLYFIQPLKSAIFIDAGGTYMNPVDKNSVQGGGITVLWDMLPHYFDNEKVLFFINSTYTSSVENRDKESEIRRAYIPVSAGIEYRYPLFQMPLFITGTAGCGVSYLKIDSPSKDNSSDTQTESAFGPYADLMIGLNYILTQDLSLYAKGGYELSYYRNNELESPKGFQMNAGVRIPVFGNYKSLGGVDDEYNDSEPVQFYNRIKKSNSKDRTTIGFYPGFFYSIGTFSEMYNDGFGGIFTLSRNNTFFNNFEAGISTGFFFLFGEDLTDKNNKTYQDLVVVPFYLTTGYNICLGKSFVIKPVLSFGGTYLDAYYTDYNKTDEENKDTDLTVVEPSFKAGITAEFRVTKSVSISAVSEYGFIKENSGLLNFAIFSAGIGYSF